MFSQPTIIRFEDPDAFGEHHDKVVEILEENGIPQGSYPATKTFPPIYIVPEVESEDHPSVSGLRELGGVIVDIQTDDD
ncbi:uncharacterized protein N7503_004277 [Penicillium pulvis]|uniref:uncharacterized protein n=1 Tax=Penicillium pulvis TaxID=1562058 RepID=UPI0025474F52|nr:uncharacterized protein N7503_004277 [Penicillium pulvis]KAJ5806675.1 hypothetical protein N7503_004277 [Penicillium pulvis]